MHTATHYLALSFALLPLSALVTLSALYLHRELRTWSRRTRGSREFGNRYRDESWHTLQAGQNLQTRTRR
jgi:hypothetical protein